MSLILYYTNLPTPRTSEASVSYWSCKPHIKAEDVGAYGPISLGGLAAQKDRLVFTLGMDFVSLSPRLSL